MNWEETYPIVAKEISETVTDRTNDTDHLRNALLAMIDLTTIISGSNDGYGREAALDLLYKMNGLYKSGQNIYFYSPTKNKFVADMNSFTVRYFGDLTEFVNSLNWEDDCIPVAWASLSEGTGSDTSNWNICPIS